MRLQISCVADDEAVVAEGTVDNREILPLRYTVRRPRTLNDYWIFAFPLALLYAWRCRISRACLNKRPLHDGDARMMVRLGSQVVYAQRLM